MTAAPTTAIARRAALRWLPTFLGFPLGGLLAELAVGPVDDLLAAVLGGLVTGAVLGIVQWAGLGRLAPPPEVWVLATAIGFGAGLGLGAAAVGYSTDAADLAIQGACCGLAVGAAQGLALTPRVGPVGLVWAPVLAAAWTIGWLVTTAIGVDVESQYTVFGSSGALVVTLLTLSLPLVLVRRASGGAR